MNSLIQNASGYAAAFRAADTTSEPMRRAIQEWFDLAVEGIHKNETNRP